MDATLIEIVGDEQLANQLMHLEQRKYFMYCLQNAAPISCKSFVDKFNCKIFEAQFMHANGFILTCYIDIDNPMYQELYVSFGDVEYSIF